MKKCLILADAYKAQAKTLSQKIAAFLDERGVESSIFPYDGNKVLSGEAVADFAGVDFTVTLGGDGTVLYACRCCAPRSIPVIAVNLGEFGFIAPVQPALWRDDLEIFLAGKSRVSERFLARCEVLRRGKTVFESLAMNDCVISCPSSRLVNLSVAYNHALLGPFKSSGIIISTPTGSTAYSVAAGGPIIEPETQALLLTPVSSFSLSARALVFGEAGELAITVMPSRFDVSLACDGQVRFPLETDDVLIVQAAQCKAQLVGATQEKFYAALQSKLNWSGAPRS